MNCSTPSCKALEGLIESYRRIDSDGWELSYIGRVYDAYRLSIAGFDNFISLQWVKWQTTLYPKRASSVVREIENSLELMNIRKPEPGNMTATEVKRRWAECGIDLDNPPC